MKRYIKSIKDFPRKGVLFRDITPLLQNRKAFLQARTEMYLKMKPQDPDKIVAIEARGFILGTAMAIASHSGLVIVRKPGKLPRETKHFAYANEYNEVDCLAMHTDAIKKGNRVVIVDDVLATGGTAATAACLVRLFGGIVEQFLFLIEIKALKGREKLRGYNVESIIKY